MLERLDFAPRRGNLQRVPPRVTQNESSAGRKQPGETRVVEELLRQRSRAAADVLFAVGRVGQDEVELPSRLLQLGDDGEHVLRADFQRVRGDARRQRILADELRVARGHFNADGMGGAAAQGLEAQGARPGEEFEHGRARDPRAQAVEDRLLDEVRRGPDGQPLRHLQNPPRRVATRDAHGLSLAGTIRIQRAEICAARFGRARARSGWCSVEPAAVAPKRRYGAREGGWLDLLGAERRPCSPGHNAFVMPARIDTRVTMGVMQPLEPPDTHYLNAALGWLELGLRDDARAELEQISSGQQRHPDVLEARWAICANEGRWDAALDVARHLLLRAPDRASGWLHCAYALRRTPDGGLEKAWEALKPAAERFPKEPIIPYNLSCYACQMEQFDEARLWIRRAIKIGGKEQIKPMALADPDLEPLWEEIRQL